MGIIKFFKDRALERRVRAFEEILMFSRRADNGEITLPKGVYIPILKSTRQVKKYNRKIKKLNGL